MTRQATSADSTSATENSETHQPSGKQEIDDPIERKILDTDNNMAEVAQPERQTLPGVTSLISNHHLRLAVLAGLPSMSRDAYNQELMEKPEAKNEDTNQTRVEEDTISHYHNPNMSYLTSDGCTDKTGYVPEEQENTKNYKESANYSFLQHNLSKSVAELIQIETPLIVGALDGRAVSESKLQLPFEDHRGFINHSRMCYSGNPMEPLSPDTAPSEKHLDVCTSVLDRSPINYSYQNYLSSWEQENNRFFNVTCRNDVYAEKGIACVIPGDVGSAKTHVKNYGIVNNINIDNCCFSKSFATDASCGSLGSNGRRRRRRVQTPVQRTAANMRERRRMCHLNVAFDRLKERLPNIKKKQKLSRIQTLKAAIDYINLLRDSLSL